jgi:hypothetical protein
VADDRCLTRFLAARGGLVTGIAYFYHRTLEEYVEEFAAAGLAVTRLADLSAMASVQEPDTILPAGFRFPRFMLLALVKAG